MAHQPAIGTLNDESVKIVSLPRTELKQLSNLNILLFGEDRLINRLDHEILLALLLTVNGVKAGFKVGYGMKNGIFYSAKGGILPHFRGKGFAGKLMHHMIQYANSQAFQRFEYDTFPNMHPGMLVLGLKQGFKITDMQFDKRQNDYKIRLSVSITEYLFDLENPEENAHE